MEGIVTPANVIASLACPILILLTLGYLALCVAQPFGPCRRCQGQGHTAATFGRRRPCPRCRATGLRLRKGRRFLIYARRVHRDATRDQNPRGGAR